MSHPVSELGFHSFASGDVDHGALARTSLERGSLG